MWYYTDGAVTWQHTYKMDDDVIRRHLDQLMPHERDFPKLDIDKIAGIALTEQGRAWANIFVMVGPWIANQNLSFGGIVHFERQMIIFEAVVCQNQKEVPRTTITRRLKDDGAYKIRDYTMRPIAHPLHPNQHHGVVIDGTLYYYMDS